MNKLQRKIETMRRWAEEMTEKTTGRSLRFVLGISMLILAGAALLLMLLIGADARHVRFYITGGPEITVAYGKPYEEPGVRAVAVGRITGEGKTPLPVAVEGSVDSSRVGEYSLSYTARTMLRSYSISRRVHVADLTPPEISLRHDEDYTPSWLEGYVEEGYSALDDLDGDLTARVLSWDEGDERIYAVTDAADNEARVVRRLPYTLGRPTILLNGGETLELKANYQFVDPGFTALDSKGNDLSAYVRREGEIQPFVPGEYELRYSIVNALGEEVSATRRVTVLPLRNPDTVEPGDKVIYLTFDDGPGPYTDRLLDILARYNVPATFFVTCRYPEYFHCIGRAYREGHSIGVHSATHSYRTIYASEDAFFADFDAVEAMIRDQTGSYTPLCRFPGGSSNTVSRFNRGIMTRLTKEVEARGFRYFDWNVSSGDAGETTSTAVVVSNIIEGCSAEDVSVVLQHDIKDFSVDAVEQVIVWALNNGYVFAALDENSPTEHHLIAN